MEPEGSLPHSQVPATCPYPEIVSKNTLPFYSFLTEAHQNQDQSHFMLPTVRNLKIQNLCLTSSELDVAALGLEVSEPSQLGPLNNAILKL